MALPAWTLGVIATVGLTARRRQRTIIYRDRDGDWVNSQRDATMFCPAYRTMDFTEVQANFFDLWCYYEPISRGDVVVDIGAGIGDDATILSRLVGASGRVVAIEAHPRTFRCMTKTIRFNKLENVIPLDVAVTDREQVLMISDRSHVANFVGAETGIEIRARPLDAILSELGLEPTLVKMNIEGAEVDALLGAAETLKRCPRWIISCHDFCKRPGAYTHERVVSIFRDAGFTVRPPREDARPWIPDYVYAEKS